MWFNFLGVAEHRGNIGASHPAAPGLNLNTPENFQLKF